MSKLVFVVVMLCCVKAGAEQIPLRAGQLSFESVMASEATITLEGKDFSFEGYGYGNMGANQCVTPCDPGDTMDVGGFIYEFFGPATWQDEKYNIGVFDGTDNIFIDIEGSVQIPRHRAGRDSKTIYARVKIQGDFYHSPGVPMPIEEEEIIGTARAAMQLTWLEPFGWTISSLNYDIRRR